MQIVDILEPLSTVFISVIEKGDLGALQTLQHKCEHLTVPFIIGHMTEEIFGNFFLSLLLLQVDRMLSSYLLMRRLFRRNLLAIGW